MSHTPCKELYCPICQRISGEAGKDLAGVSAESESQPTILAACPFCGNTPEPPYTNNVQETWARLTHSEGCALGLGETFRQTHWIPSTAFEAWNTRATDVPEWQPEAPLLRSILPIEISSANAIAYQLEQGKDNGDLSREVLAVTLRRFAKTFEAANSFTQPTVSPEADNSTTVPDHG